jgi:hypothetical protein
MTERKKRGKLEISGSLGGVSGAVRLGSDGKIEVQFGIDKRRKKK